MKIINSLQANGWKILNSEEGMIFAERILTKKLAFFIKENFEINEEEIMRVWTKKGFHPFVYEETDHGVTYYDFLFDEIVKRP